MNRADVQQAVTLIQSRYHPRIVLAGRDVASSDPTGAQSGLLNEVFAGKESADGQPVLYVCQNFACQAPAVGLTAIEVALDAISPPPPTRNGSAI
jgi:hypothetical protein